MIKASGILLALASVGFSLALSPTATPQTKSADRFDPPLQKKVVDLGPSPYYFGVNVRVKLSCFAYPTFMVKEYGEGAKGDAIAIAPAKRGAVPECTRDAAVGQRAVEEGGYFQGAKGNLVFINAPDGTDGGLPFVVYDVTTGKKIFQDSAFQPKILGMKVEDSPFNELRISKAQDGRMYLRYLRVVATDCDLHLKEIPCWERTQRELELKNARMPVCSGYASISTRWASAVAYPVEVFLFPQATTKTIAGPVKCWPVD